MLMHRFPALTRNAALTAILAVAPAMALGQAHAADQGQIQKVNGTVGMTQGQQQGTAQGAGQAQSPSTAQGTAQGTTQGAGQGQSPGTAQGTAQGTTQGAGQGQSPSTAQGTAQTQSTAEMQSGGEITLTQQEAGEWEMRPVVNENEEQVGQVTQVVLNDQGNISELHFETGQALGIGAKTVKVEPSDFSAGAQQVKLNMSNQEIQDLPEAQTSQ